MAKKTKQNLKEKSTPNLTRIKRKRRRKQKTAAGTNLIQKQHNMNLRPKKTSILSRLMNERSIKCTEDRNYGLNIKVTCPTSSSNTVDSKAIGKKKTKKNQSILAVGESVLFKTIDVTGDEDTNSDVVLVNDGEDEVIYVTDDPTREDHESPDGEESVIVIDDDSNVENVMLPNSKVTNNTEILPASNINESLIKAPNTNTYIKSRKGGILRQLRLSRSKIANNNNHEVTKYNAPNLSPIPAVNSQQTNIFELPTLATSTPARNLSVPINSVPNLMENIANMQIMQPAISMTSQRLTQQMTDIPNGMSNNYEIFGSNYVNVGPIRTTGLRPIFIDGSNIAMSHSNGRYFSVQGLKICIDYFKFRGHEVTAIVPTFRKRVNQSSNSKLLQKLEKAGHVVFTPSRTVNGRHIVPYDDRYIVLLAHVHQGIIVSADNYRDLLQENPSLLDTIENRILTPTWLKDMLIFPTDPMGRNGPKLEEFLRFP